MTSESATLPARLAAVLVRLVPENNDAFNELREHCAYDITFQDPIQIVHGLPDFIAMNERLLGRMRDLDWEIRGQWGDDETAAIEWTMRGKPKLGPKISVDGMTRVKARGGKIFEHRDYWDLGELAASGIPGGKRVLRAIMSPFA